MQLLVRSLSGRTRAVSAAPTDSVADLKRALSQVRDRGRRWVAHWLRTGRPSATAPPPLLLPQGADGLPAQHQVLVHCGRLLEDDAILEACGLGAGSTVHQTARLLGGKPVKVGAGRLQGWRQGLLLTVDCPHQWKLCCEPSQLMGSNRHTQS